MALTGKTSIYFQNGICQIRLKDPWFSTLSQELVCIPHIIWCKKSWRKECEGNYQKLWEVAALYRDVENHGEWMREHWSVI